ncbi:MAG: hypothetical protein AAFR90_03340 [Pseudomonadota bacterium]
MGTPPFQNSHPQNSPAQILNNAQRAESGGLTKFALQFYRQIIEQYPGAPEATAAQEGLKRLMNTHAHGMSAQPPPPGVQPPVSASSPIQHGNLPSRHPPIQGHNPTPPAMRTQNTNLPGLIQQESAAPPVYKTSQLQQPPGPGQPDLKIGGSPKPKAQQTSFAGEMNNQPSQGGNTTRSKLNLEPVASEQPGKRIPPFKEPKLRRYPLGNVFASLMVVFGVCILGVGMGLMTLVLIEPNLAGSIAGGRSPVLVGIIALIVLALGIIFIVNGIVARAVFANARILHGLALAALQNYGQSRNN